MDINQEITVTVHAELYWNESPVVVRRGETYTFTTTGSWKDAQFECDANGYTVWYLKPVSWMLRLRNKKYFSLIGSLDKEADFETGLYLTRTFDKPGRLFFYANDVKGFYGNNSGTVKVTIRRIA
jgi:hypothetical protein